MNQNIWHAQHLAGSLLSDLANVLEFCQLRGTLERSRMSCCFAPDLKSWKLNILRMDEAYNKNTNSGHRVHKSFLETKGIQVDYPRLSLGRQALSVEYSWNFRDSLVHFLNKWHWTSSQRSLKKAWNTVWLIISLSYLATHVHTTRMYMYS